MGRAEEESHRPSPVQASYETGESDSERILAYNIGLSIHDVRFAANIYKLMMERNIALPDIDLKEPAQKFWF